MKLLTTIVLFFVYYIGTGQVKFAKPTIFTEMPSKGKIVSVISVKQRYWDEKHPEKITYKDSSLSIYDKHNKIVKLVEYTGRGSENLVTEILYNKKHLREQSLRWNAEHDKVVYREEYEYDKYGNETAFRAFKNGGLVTTSLKHTMSMVI